MTTRIDRAQVEHIAQLASLVLADDETERLTRELAEMVRYVEELNELDTSNVEPTAYVQLERSELRGDAVEASLQRDETLAQAPQSAHGGFAVPTFVEN
ncbi:Asp-tRNA(Asn)/Glu-tRNA(Gln) amidotransferase subunit GatC [Pendulispora brunnea]|uniref:Aspartyl/glutamyl-tRNA(Asn/Gln) amidotransferase subunit C n=1 Tax=Pendulispora brunnea TaxID=2905690 RepID=A0ABZ2KL23_9BACT